MMANQGFGRLAEQSQPNVLWADVVVVVVVGGVVVVGVVL